MPMAKILVFVPVVAAVTAQSPMSASDEWTGCMFVSDATPGGVARNVCILTRSTIQFARKASFVKVVSLSALVLRRSPREGIKSILTELIVVLVFLGTWSLTRSEAKRRKAHDFIATGVAVTAIVLLMFVVCVLARVNLY